MCCHIPSQRSVKLYQSILQPNDQEYSGLQGSLYQSTWSPVCCGYHARISLTQELVPSFDYLLKTLTISVRYLTPRQNKDPSDMFTCTLIYQTQVISIIEVHTAKEFNPTAILHLLPFASLYPLLPVIHDLDLFLWVKALRESTPELERKINTTQQFFTSRIIRQKRSPRPRRRNARLGWFLNSTPAARGAYTGFSWLHCITGPAYK